MEAATTMIWTTTGEIESFAFNRLSSSSSRGCHMVATGFLATLNYHISH